MTSAIHIRLKKQLPQEKINAAVTLYERLIEWDAQKNRIAYAKTGGLPWASLSTICKMMNWPDKISARYTAMSLKDALWKAGLVAFDNETAKRDKQAARFLILDKIKELILKAWREESKTQAPNSHEVVVTRMDLLASLGSRSLAVS